MEFIASLIRILFGLLVACLAAGLTQVLFVITPVELLATPSSALAERLGGAGILALVGATQAAVFSSPFALIAVAVGEWQGLRSWIYYALAGLAISVAAFFAQYNSEQGGPTIVNDYALQAFLATGFIAGLAYWATSGRFVSPARRARSEEEVQA
jgi:hypothetical protein